MEVNYVLAIAGLIQTAVGAVMGYVAWVLSNMRADTKERLQEITEHLIAMNGRLRDVEECEARSDEWRKEYVKAAERCHFHFEAIDRELRELHSRARVK